MPYVPAALLCAGSEGLKSAEIPKGSSWSAGIDKLREDSVDETGGIHLCSDTKDGVKKDRWVISVPGAPMDGIKAAVNRPEGFDPSENITLVEAINGYTVKGDEVNGDAGFIGSLDAGEIADFQLRDDL